jgi:hypothetical protein
MKVPRLEDGSAPGLVVLRCTLDGFGPDGMACRRGELRDPSDPIAKFFAAMFVPWAPPALPVIAPQEIPE